MSIVTGKVAQIVGPVIDVEFGAGSELPKIYDSLEIKKADGSLLVLEVQSHIGEDTVRTIAMDSSDGLSRGTEVTATGSPIQMPIGGDIYGRLLTLLGMQLTELVICQNLVLMVYQFIDKHLNLKIYRLLPKFYLLVLKSSI